MAIDNSAQRTAARADLLCVLGMHRSGTSAVTQFLHRLGAAVAPHLLEAMAGVNQEGFWEDRFVVEMNERLLIARGGRWYDGCVALTTQDAFAEAQIGSEAISYFKTTYATKALSVLKDPRLCRLLPFWLDVWAAADVNPIFVHVVRHPFAVAKSLQRRDKIPYEYGIALWLLHTVEAMLYTGAYAGLTVVYDTFLQRPLELAETLVSKYRVALPGGDAAWLEAAGDAIKKDLQHNDDRIDTPLGLHELHIFAVSLYEAITVSAYAGVERNQLELWHARLQQLLRRYDAEMAMLRRLCTDLMSLSADNVRVGELHTAALAVIRTKDAVISDRDQFIRDLLHLKFWRLVPRIIRKVRRT